MILGIDRFSQTARRKRQLAVSATLGHHRAGYRGEGPRKLLERSRIVDEAWLRRLCNRPAGLAFLAIIGEAMQPTLQHGDEVIIHRLRSHDALQNGLYAVPGSAETFVRRIALDPTKNHISVLTDHLGYPSWNCVQRKAVNVVGKVT